MIRNERAQSAELSQLTVNMKKGEEHMDEEAASPIQNLNHARTDPIVKLASASASASVNDRNRMRQARKMKLRAMPRVNVNAKMRLRRRSWLRNNDSKFLCLSLEELQSFPLHFQWDQAHDLAVGNNQ